MVFYMQTCALKKCVRDDNAVHIRSWEFRQSACVHCSEQDLGKLHMLLLSTIVCSVSEMLLLFFLISKRIFWTKNK